MTDSKTYSWQARYLSAILEIDPTKMLDRIDEALRAIDERLRTLIEIDGHEYKAIENAQRGLAALRAERVKGPTFRIDL
jgi:D-serine deaminase-like pyridoxal phosphate-dependent protein